MEKKLRSYNVKPIVKPIVMCCKTIILGRNIENKLVGVTVNYDKNKDKYYVFCPICNHYQYVDKDDIVDLIE